MPDFAARVQTLSAEGAEDGRPVGSPGFVAFEVRLGDEIGYAVGEMVNDRDCASATGDGRILPERR